MHIFNGIMCKQNHLLKKKNNPVVCFISLHILKYLVSCTNKIISCTYNVNYANWRKLEILNFINLMHVSFWECIFHLCHSCWWHCADCCLCPWASTLWLEGWFHQLCCRYVFCVPVQNNLWKHLEQVPIGTYVPGKQCL